MADSVKIKITGDASDFNKELTGAGKNAADVFKGVMASQVVTKGVSLLTQGLRSSIQTGMEFGAAMSQVAAISGATDAELAKLTETAKHYGETTMFSASQAADALNYMALAGWDAQQSIDALGGVLDLAAASGMDLGAASDAVTDYLSAFNMEASKAGYMADLMAYAQSKSNTSASQLADAYGNCASSMNAANQDIETTTALLMSLANQGIKGSEAGTQLSAMMRDLTSKMENGKIMIGKTAVAVQDAKGNFRDLNDIIADVGKATDGMGSAEKSAALMETFTARSIKAINTLLNDGMDNVNAYEEALRGSEGTAAEQAKIMMDNLAGDVKIFQSALEGVQITASEKLDDAARAIVQEGTSVLEAISLGGKTGGIGGMADALFDQIPELVPKATKGLEKLLGGVSKRLPGLMSNLIRTLPSILSGAGGLVPVLIESLTSAAGAAVEGLITNLPGIVGSVASAVPDILKSAAGSAVSLADTLLNALGIIDTRYTKYQDLGKLSGQLTYDVDVDTSVNWAEAQKEIDTQLQSFVDYLKGQGLTTEQVAQVLAFKGTKEELDAWLDANYPNLDQAAKDTIMEKFTAGGEGGLASLFAEGENYGLTTEDIAQLMVSTDLTEASVQKYLEDNFPNLDDAAKNAIIAKLPKADEGGGLSTLFSEGEAQGLTTEQVAALIMDTDLNEESVQKYLEDNFPDLSSAAKNAFTEVMSGGEGGSLAATLKTELADLGIKPKDIAEIITAQAEGDESTVESILTEKYAGVKDEALNAIRAAFPEGGLGASLTSELQGLGISNADIVTLITAQAEGDESTIESLLTEKYAGIKDQAWAAIKAAWDAGGDVSSGVEGGSMNLMASLITEMFTDGVTDDQSSIDAAMTAAKTAIDAKIKELRDYIANGGENTAGAQETIDLLESFGSAYEEYATNLANHTKDECAAAGEALLQLATDCDAAMAQIMASNQQLMSMEGNLYQLGSNGAQLSLEDARHANNYLLNKLNTDRETAQKAFEEAKRNAKTATDYDKAQKDYDDAMAKAYTSSANRLARLVKGQSENIEGLDVAGALNSVRDQLIESVSDNGGTLFEEELAQILRNAGYGDDLVGKALQLVFGEQSYTGKANLASLEGQDFGEELNRQLADYIGMMGQVDASTLAEELRNNGYGKDVINQVLSQLFTPENMGAENFNLDSLLGNMDFGSLGSLVLQAINNGLVEGLSTEGLNDNQVTELVHQTLLDLLGGTYDIPPIETSLSVQAEVTAEEVDTSQLEDDVEESGPATITQDVEANVGNVTVNGAEEIGQQVDAEAASGNTGAQLSSATGNAVNTAIREGEAEASGASSIGSAIAAGLANGISGNISEVVSAAREAVRQAIEAAKSEADSHSPSRKMMEVGKWYDEGLAIGIADNASLVVNQAVRMAQRAVGAINTRPLLDLSAIAGTVDGALHDIAGIEGNRPLVLAINGREMGRVMAADNAIEQNAYNRRVAISYGQGGRL